jgi:hypothetical protein
LWIWRKVKRPVWNWTLCLSISFTHLCCSALCLCCACVNAVLELMNSGMINYLNQSFVWMTCLLYMEFLDSRTDILYSFLAIQSFLAQSFSVLGHKFYIYWHNQEDDEFLSFRSCNVILKFSWKRHWRDKMTNYLRN